MIHASPLSAKAGTESLQKYLFTTPIRHSCIIKKHGSRMGVFLPLIQGHDGIEIKVLKKQGKIPLETKNNC